MRGMSRARSQGSSAWSSSEGHVAAGSKLARLLSAILRKEVLAAMLTVLDVIIAISAGLCAALVVWWWD